MLGVSSPRIHYLCCYHAGNKNSELSPTERTVLYQKVAAGEETKRVLDVNSRKDYRQQLEKELKEIAASEMWQAGAVVRALRPERATKGEGKKQ